jgi:ribosome-binding factor A
MTRRPARPARPYSRVVRVNATLHEIIADELERIDDDRLGLATVTGVSAEPDLRHAVVWLSSLTDEAIAALADHRARLQAAIGRQARLKRTPALEFRPDPGVSSGWRVEEILRNLREEG